MARYVATFDVVIDGSFYERGSVVNIASSVIPLNEAASYEMDPLPRLRRVDDRVVGTWPTPAFVPVAVADQLGRQQSTLDLPEQGTIKEPVLPVDSGQYD